MIDFAIVILVIAVGLILFAILWLIKIKAPEHETMLFKQRLLASAERDARLIGAAKILTFGGKGYMTKGVGEDGLIEYQVVMRIDGDAQIVDTKTELARTDAIQLINDSIMMNGGESKQVLTCDEWQKDHGHDRDDWEEAKKWLCSAGYAQARRGGSEPGTFVLTGSLNAAMLAMAVHGRPPRPQLVEAARAMNGGNKGS